MAGFEIRTVSYSPEVNAALQSAGIRSDDLLKEHETAPVDECGWATSSFSPPELGGKTLWAITDTRKQSTLLVFEGQ